jgi:hypothetical protein
MTGHVIKYTNKDTKRPRYMVDEGKLSPPRPDGQRYDPTWTDDIAYAKAMDPAVAEEIAGDLPKQDDMVGGFEVTTN